MDIPRKSRKVRRIVIRVIVVIITVGAITAITLGLSRLEPAAPTVERQTLLIDSVKRGDIFLEVRGVGTLVSEDMLVVPAEVSGRTTRILVEAGTPVEPNTVILELSNPELQLNWLNAQSQLNSAKARRNAQTASLHDQLLGIEAGLAQTQANLNEAKLRFQVDKKQFDDGLISELQMTLSKSGVEELDNLLKIQMKRYDVFRDQSKLAQLAELDALVEQAQSLYNLRKA